MRGSRGIISLGITTIIALSSISFIAITRVSASLGMPPETDFSYSPINPTDLDVINFYDMSTDVDGEIVNWT